MQHRLIGALILVAGLMLAASSADAQTRISLDAGGLIPTGDMADVHEFSPYVGARWEFQPVNALGHISTRTWFIRMGYGILQKDDLPAFEGTDSDGHYLDACLGVRAYASSRFSPFFMSVSGGYAQYELPGESDTFRGGTLNGGLGVRFPVLGFVLECEARGHLAILNDADDIQFFTGIVSLGIPL